MAAVVPQDSGFGLLMTLLVFTSGSYHIMGTSLSKIMPTDIKGQEGTSLSAVESTYWQSQNAFAW